MISSPRPSRRWGVALFISLSAFYFGVGTLLILRYNLFDADAASRVANAGFAFMSRQPHLSAIGFVWNPLPSLIEIPFVWLSHWWPPLKTHALAGCAQSSLLMAGAVVMLRAIAIDRGVAKGWRWLAVASFAFHPIIVIYGQSGLSEAGEVICLLWAVRYLLLWLDSGLPKDLTWSGVAMAGGYLSRYEFVIATVGAAILIGIVIFLKTPGGNRLTSIAISILVLVLPIMVIFIIWAVAGWVLANELFAQLTSRYGNAAQVANSVGHQGGVRPPYTAWSVIGGRLFAMQPLVVLAAGTSVVISLLRRRFDALVPLAVIGPILAFAIYGQHTPTTFGFFRFYITAIPLVACIALACWLPAPAQPPLPPQEARSRLVGKALLCSTVLLAAPVTAISMFDPRIGDPQLQYGLSSVLFPDRFHTGETWFRRLNVNERELATFFDEQHLLPGTVLMDSANTWGIWLKSSNTKQFVITSDYDFTAALNRPWERGVKYIVVSSPQNFNADAVAIRYPTIWGTGAEIGVPVLAVAGADGLEAYRIFEVVKPPDY